jgi:hypothetical protein
MSTLGLIAIGLGGAFLVHKVLQGQSLQNPGIVPGQFPGQSLATPITMAGIDSSNTRPVSSPPIREVIPSRIGATFASGGGTLDNSTYAPSGRIRL